MADEHRSGFCEHCKKRVVVFRPGPNHALHLLLSILTVGWWLIIWLLSCVQFGGWRCVNCGSKSVKHVS